MSALIGKNNSWLHRETHGKVCVIKVADYTFYRFTSVVKSIASSSELQNFFVFSQLPAWVISTVHW